MSKEREKLDYQHELKLKELAYERDTQLMVARENFRLQLELEKELRYLQQQPQQQYYPQYPQQFQQQSYDEPRQEPEQPRSEFEKSQQKYGKGAK